MTLDNGQKSLMPLQGLLRLIPWKYEHDLHIRNAFALLCLPGRLLKKTQNFLAFIHIVSGNIFSRLMLDVMLVLSPWYGLDRFTFTSELPPRSSCNMASNLSSTNLQESLSHDVKRQRLMQTLLLRGGKGDSACMTTWLTRICCLMTLQVHRLSMHDEDMLFPARLTKMCIKFPPLQFPMVLVRDQAYNNIGMYIYGWIHRTCPLQLFYRGYDPQLISATAVGGPQASRTLFGQHHQVICITAVPHNSGKSCNFIVRNRQAIKKRTLSVASSSMRTSNLHYNRTNNEKFDLAKLCSAIKLEDSLPLRLRRQKGFAESLLTIWWAFCTLHLFSPPHYQTSCVC